MARPGRPFRSARLRRRSELVLADVGARVRARRGAREHLEQAERLGAAIGRLQLRIRRHAYLRDQERHEEEQQQRERGEPVAARQAAQPAVGRDPRQRRGGEQVEPSPHRRTGFVQAERKREQRDHAGRSPEQPRGRRRHNEHDEEVEQTPAPHPAARRVVRAERRQQLVAWGQMQRRRHRHIGAPADDGHLAAGNATKRLYIRIAPPDLDAAAIRALVLCRRCARDGHRSVAFLGSEQDVGPRHLQAPAGAHRAADAIHEREPAPVEVQPQVAFQGELVFGGHDAAAALHDRQRVAGRQPKGRKVRPRRTGDRRIDWIRRLGRRDAQVWTRGVAPDLRGRHVPFPWRHGGLGDDTVRPGSDVDLPVAGSDLQPQRAVLQSRRQIAPQGHRHEARRQHRAQRFFAHAAGDIDVEGGVEARWHVVVQLPKDLRRERVLGARLGIDGTEPQTVVAPRQRDRHAVHGERHQAHLGGNGEFRRTFLPSKETADAVFARRQPQRRLVVAQHQGRWPPIDGYVARPVLGVARQRHPLFAAVQRPALLEPAPFRIDLDGEAPRPSAHEIGAILGGAAVEEGAAPVLVAMQHPIAPPFKRVGHRNALRALNAQGGEQRAGEPGSSQKPRPHGQPSVRLFALLSSYR